MSDQIFKNGFLDKVYLNPKYVGVSGWDVLWKPDFYKNSGCKLIALNELSAFTDEGEKNINDLEVPEFGIDSIPIGDLVWIYSDLTRDWVLTTFVGTAHRHTVPYLIAETASDAERMKNWDINN